MVTVVSGVPRSGTSLMMQMLLAGGLPVLTDGKRQPDAHNPQGYFEYEVVKGLARDSSWMPLAEGKALKVIYRLLPRLPVTAQYSVIFMERDMRDVFASQRKMLLTRGDAAAEQGEEKLVAAIAAEVAATKQWLAQQANMRTLYVPYAGVMAQPLPWAQTVADFLGGGLDANAMAAAVRS